MREDLMDYINKIELQGKVGTVRSNVVNGSRVVNFSLVTDYLYKTREGNPVSEATWINIVAWEGKDNLNMEQIAKGATVNVQGRIRSTKFEGADGNEKQLYEVFANRLRVIERAQEAQQ
jgi:single-strand DNA-binding protein